ncbi:hypothetical protein B0I35DRAFT_405153 [Stachybotrys elegans]|uniref:Uncharacterized protein n=1 Tax=Stachybotrys elegans TaxID=80388 RepID=A0A8K0SXF5_9HYPO|nr:hypothetical protein B0I35DRAFT_405153 [Stachybotrys elegans]
MHSIKTIAVVCLMGLVSITNAGSRPVNRVFNLADAAPPSWETINDQMKWWGVAYLKDSGFIKQGEDWVGVRDRFLWNSIRMLDQFNPNATLYQALVCHHDVVEFPHHVSALTFPRRLWFEAGGDTKDYDCYFLPFPFEMHFKGRDSVHEAALLIKDWHHCHLATRRKRLICHTKPIPIGKKKGISRW